MSSGDTPRTIALLEAAALRRRPSEDLAIAAEIIIRHVPDVHGLIFVLEGAGGCARLLKALRARLKPVRVLGAVVRPQAAIWDEAAERLMLGGTR